MKRLTATILKCLAAALAGVCALAVVLVVSLWVLLEVPAVQDKVRGVAERELSAFLKGDVRIGKLGVRPFNEVALQMVAIAPKGGDPCLEIASLSASVDLLELLSTGRVSIGYVALDGMEARVVQPAPDAPLNIDFIIKALEPKDRNNPPTKFDVVLHNVFIRRSSLSFDRLWIPSGGEGRVDFNHLRLTDLNLTADLPVLRNDCVEGNLRHLSFLLEPGLRLENLSVSILFGEKELAVSGLKLALPGSSVEFPALRWTFPDRSGLLEALRITRTDLRLKDAVVTPSDLAALVPALRPFSTPVHIDAELSGNDERIDVMSLQLAVPSLNTRLRIAGALLEPSFPKEMGFELSEVKGVFSPAFGDFLLRSFQVPNAKLGGIVRALGECRLKASGGGDLGARRFHGTATLATCCGAADMTATVTTSGAADIVASLATSGFDLGRLLGKPGLASAAFTADASLKLEGKVPDGELQVDFSRVKVGSRELEDLALHAVSEGGLVDLEVNSSDSSASFELLSSLDLSGVEPEVEFSLALDRLDPGAFGALPKFHGYTFSSYVEGHLAGRSLATARGEVGFHDSEFLNGEGKGLQLGFLKLIAEAPDDDRRVVSLHCDWADAELEVSEKGAGSGGMNIDMGAVKEAVLELANQTFPAFGFPLSGKKRPDLAASLKLSLKADPAIYQFFKLPAFPLGPASADCYFDVPQGVAELNVELPYIQQGKNKLISRTHLSAVLNRDSGTCGLTASTHYPAKKGDLDLDLKILGRNGYIFADIGFNRGQNALVTGALSLTANITRSALDGKLAADVSLLPSTLMVKQSAWRVERGKVEWRDGCAKVSNISVKHGRQFVTVDGTASASMEDEMKVSLAGIDLDYIFDTLNINYVSFGGTAYGEVSGRGLLSKSPEIATRGFNVRNLSYNGGLLGDAEMKSWLDNKTMMVGIGARISRDGRRTATVDGGIWVTRDSLSFDVEANQVDVAFMAPFVSAFATDLGGRASGRAKLFGTFSDIDLTGRIKADSIGLRLASTNVVYHGSDSVYLDPGKILIPSFRIYDRYGNSGILSGELSHRYFHDPVFDFRVFQARDLLCYDTNAQMNPDWYGTIFGSGSGHLTGRPGLVEVDVDMTTARGSSFTFVLSDLETVEDYNFLTFTDRRKEAMTPEPVDTIPDFLKRFEKSRKVEVASETEVKLDFRATVTPLATVTLVMDPKGGDRIVATGGGPLQMTYDSATEEMKMYGKYVLDQGSYNFTLQDIILKDFVIKQGSSIAFNGDPLDAQLDISATYRVNTNLTDLDQSFANDRELNRTNVPVDAVLNVRGDMESPEITFDIELPTLTSDVERKVKSLISTDDMMSKQMIYLLALHRFYTPEYMTSAAAPGSELSSVASSTLSSQLSNVLSNMTDHLSVAPTFRSDKGDFSDMEVDVALSSRLLDNRLLINGNLGYRDRGSSTSSTQFVGDFDIEYLLNRTGNLRLKAYNRFNDQNYYLRQALTTQGVGLVVRRDFDNIFSFLRPLRKKKEENDPSGPKGQKEQKDPSAPKDQPSAPKDQEVQKERTD